MTKFFALIAALAVLAPVAYATLNALFAEVVDGVGRAAVRGVDIGRFQPDLCNDNYDERRDNYGARLFWGSCRW